MLVGYARASTDDQDLTLQRTTLAQDQGITGQPLAFPGNCVPGLVLRRVFWESLSAKIRASPVRPVDHVTRPRPLAAGCVRLGSRLPTLLRSKPDHSAPDSAGSQ